MDLEALDAYFSFFFPNKLHVLVFVRIKESGSWANIDCCLAFLLFKQNLSVADYKVVLVVHQSSGYFLVLQDLVVFFSIDIEQQTIVLQVSFIFLCQWFLREDTNDLSVV